MILLFTSASTSAFFHLNRFGYLALFDFFFRNLSVFFSRKGCWMVKLRLTISVIFRHQQSSILQLLLSNLMCTTKGNTMNVFLERPSETRGNYHGLSLKPMRKNLKVQCQRWSLDAGCKKSLAPIDCLKSANFSLEIVSLFFFNKTLWQMIALLIGSTVALMSGMWALTESRDWQFAQLLLFPALGLWVRLLLQYFSKTKCNGRSWLQMEKNNYLNNLNNHHLISVCDGRLFHSAFECGVRNSNNHFCFQTWSDNILQKLVCFEHNDTLRLCLS